LVAKKNGQWPMVDDRGLGKSVSKFDLPKKYLIMTIVDVVLENQRCKLFRVGNRWWKFIHGPGEGLTGSTIEISSNFEINDTY
jgi:hypothetical protein